MVEIIGFNGNAGELHNKRIEWGQSKVPD
jgi:hypothetical protein